MMKTITAYTYEIDDVELAVEEILSAVAPEALLKNAIGIVTCYAEFVESGVYEALCKALPFDVVGCTTIGNATDGAQGELMLGLMVLTSDDVAFGSAATGSLRGDMDEELAAAYARALGGREEKPKMMLVFAPLIFDIAGDVMLERLDVVTGGLPVFGTLAVDHTQDYAQAVTLFNGAAQKEALSMVLLFGDISPRFMIASISEEKLIKQKAIITKANGNILHEVNGVSVLEYMHTLGLLTDGIIEGVNSIPFVIDYNDGTKPIARAIFALTEEGFAVCGGKMPLDATLAVGSIDYQEVLSTAEGLVTEALSPGGVDGMLLFSCLIRHVALGVETGDELKRVQAASDGRAPLLMSYSGGEICPVYGEGGRLINRFHNDTLVCCIL